MVNMIRIQKDTLTPDEISILVTELKKFPAIALINQNKWQIFKELYIAREYGNLVGLLAVVHLKHWIKLGPLIVLSQYQGNGIGKQLFKHVVQKYHNENLYIGSYNPAVKHLAQTYGFKETSRLGEIPIEIFCYYIGYYFEQFSWEFFLDNIRKRIFHKSEKYSFFFNK